MASFLLPSLFFFTSEPHSDGENTYKNAEGLQIQGHLHHSFLLESLLLNSVANLYNYHYNYGVQRNTILDVTDFSKQYLENCNAISTHIQLVTDLL